MVEDHLYLRVFGLLYLGLMTNLLLVLTGLPLVAVLLMTDPTQTWPLVAGAVVLASPGLPAAFTVFARYSQHRDIAVARNYFGGWRRHGRRALIIGGLTVAVAVVLAVDIVWAFGHQIGAVAIPVFGTLIVLVVGTGLGWLAAATERPEQGLWGLAKAAVYLMTRRWYLTLVSLACFLVLAVITIQSPALGLGIAAAPLLYIVWANTRHTLRPILVPDGESGRATRSAVWPGRPAG